MVGSNGRANDREKGTHMVERNGTIMERVNVEREYNMNLPTKLGSSYWATILQWQNVDEQILMKIKFVVRNHGYLVF